MTVKITELPLAASVAGSTIMYVIDPTGPTSERTTLESIADVISPTASQSVKGIVTIGTGIDVDVNGVISVPTVTTISGNAGTVTNGVYTTGSYADPTWITSLAASKVGLGSVTNESKATMFASPTFTGTVAGVTAAHVGLGNVTNESKATMFASPTFTGNSSVTGSLNVGQTILTSRFLSSPYQLVVPRGPVYQGTGVLSTLTTAIATNDYPEGIAVDPTGRFVYVANRSGGVGLFSINQTTGVLTGGSIQSAGTTPYAVTVDPTGRFLYVTNSGSASVSQFSINQTTGALTSITTAITTGTQPVGIAVDPTGRFVYVTNNSVNTVSQFSINQTTGALTSITTAIASGVSPYGIAVDPTGRFVYVTNNGGTSVSQYSIDQTTGALTSITTAIASGSSFPLGIAVDPTGRFVYVANRNNSTVSQYLINQITGALTTITTAIALPASAGPIGVTVDPTGRFVYVVNEYFDTVNQLLINQATGALTTITTAIASGDRPVTVIVDPTGRFVYVVNQHGFGGNQPGSISQYSINNFSAGQSIISSPVNSTNTQTGALQVVGGVGVGGNLNVGGTLAVAGTVSGVTAAMVGLGNVTNESKATMFTSPTFTEVPLAPTATAGTNTTQVATTQFVRTEVSNLVNGAGPALDTLKELADALGSDANFSTTISTALGLKAPLANPAFTGTPTGITATHVGLGNVTNESKATMFASPTFTGTVAGVTATHVGLGNVTNESKATMFTSPTFTGTVTIPAGASISGYATSSGATISGASISNAVGMNFASGVLVSGFSDDGTFASNASNKVPVESAVKTYVDTGLALKANLASPTFTGTVAGVTKAHVGLGNVTNESKATMFASPTFTGTVSGVTATHVGLGNVTNESKATMFTNPAIKQTAGAGGITLTSEGGWPAGIQFKSSGGTFDAPTQTGNGYNVLNISAQGYAGGGFTTLGWMEWTSTEVITSNNRGSQLSLYANRVGGPASYGLFWNGEIFDTTQGKIKATGITTGGSTTAGTLTGAWTLTGSISGVTATMVGLGNVTNESKATMFASPTFTGTVSGVTATHVGLGSVTNESKATMFSSPTFTGTVSGVTKAHVGLGSVDNTADSAKSVSYASTAGRAYPYRSDGGALNFYWSGQSGQPTWLWGGSDGSNMYVYNPSNFSVNYASSAGSAPASDVYAWAKASVKPSYTNSEVGLGNVGNYTVNQNVGTGNDVTHNTVTAAAFYYSSDATLKTNIGTLTNYWETLDALRPVSFDWISNGKKDLGLLAQDVQSVLPESVTTTDAGTLAISSSGIIANLVAAVKDLKRQVEELTKQLKG